MKNLKKGLAVAMSLAMIATVMPTMNVNAAVPACSTATTNNAKDLLYAMATDLGVNKLKDLSLDDATTVTWTKTKEVIDKIKESAVTLSNNKLETLLATKIDASDTTVLEYITAYVDCDGGNDVAKLLAGVKDDGATTRSILAKVDALDDALENLETWYKDGGTYEVADLNATTYAIVQPEYAKIVTYYDTFKGNIADSTKEDRQGFYADYFERMKSDMEDYQSSFIGKFVDDFVKAFKATDIIEDVITVDKAVNDTDKFNYENLSDLEDFIKDLKADKITMNYPVGTTADKKIAYTKVADEDEVAELVEGLEGIVTDMKAVKELLKTTSQVIKDYKTISTGADNKVVTLKNAAEGYNANTDATVVAYESALSKFREEDITKLTNYVEDLVAEFFTVEAVKRTNGNYTLRFKDADYARYVELDEVVSDDLQVILTTNLVKTDSESVYDELASKQNAADKLIAAVKAIDGIRIGTTFTSADAAKIVAAKNAYNELVNEDGTANTAYGLTAKELRTVKSYNTAIEALYTKLILTGTITESGWIDLGNGNWDYINADGSKSTKWVAAGKDWYFVQAGHMLRNSWVAQDATGAVWYYVDNAGKMVVNTTIDGYVINANGEWHKK